MAGVDRLTPVERSLLMAQIHGKDTRPERLVRSVLHRLGFRFQLHRRDLPGTPDIVLPGRRTVVFVHGCFWHGHRGCKDATTPKTRTEFWVAKIRGNIARDRRHVTALRNLGWRVVVVWECRTKNPAILAARLRRQLPKHGPAEGSA